MNTAWKKVPHDDYWRISREVDLNLPPAKQDTADMAELRGDLEKQRDEIAAKGQFIQVPNL